MRSTITPHVAHDWELQAMIKVRHSAGDVGLAREFVRRVQPFVYRPELNFLAIKTALASREKIGSHRRQRLLKQTGQSGIDVKLDRGGIRDIEFLVQCLQRVYGGSESWLRSRGTMFALQKLYDKEHISSKDFHNLTNAYEFLRNLEHRLQLRHGQQTHRLPESRAELQALARSLTREGTTAPNPRGISGSRATAHGGGGGDLSASHLSGAEPGPPWRAGISAASRRFLRRPRIPTAR